jgi:hypothetical protein
MTNEERAITDKRDEIVRAASNGQYQDADDILKAYANEIRQECKANSDRLEKLNYKLCDKLDEADRRADEIRRECADRSVAYCKKYEGFLDGEDDQYLSAAIMGKEAGE